MSLDFSIYEASGALQNPNLCPIHVVKRVISLLESEIPDHKKDTLVMTLSRNAHLSKRFVAAVNSDADTHGELAQEIAGKVVRHTVFDTHLREKCIPLKTISSK